MFSHAGSQFTLYSTTVATCILHLHLQEFTLEGSCACPYTNDNLKCSSGKGGRGGGNGGGKGGSSDPGVVGIVLLCL